MALTTRRIKQAVFGVGALATLMIVGALVVVAVRPAPAPSPTPTPTSLFAPIVLEDVSLITHPVEPGEAVTVDVVARLRNPNPRAGIAEYPVTFTFVSASDQTLGEVTVPTYLLPASLAYAVKIGVTLPGVPARIDTHVPENPTFTVVPGNLSLPRFSATVRPRTTKTIAADVIEEQKGLVTNLSALDWQFVEVVGVAVNQNGRPVAVGQTFLGELRAGEQREFTLQWPAPADSIARVTILPTTNLYRQENIIRAIGDPNLLR